jgi:hypothetical protein
MLPRKSTCSHMTETQVGNTYEKKEYWKWKLGQAYEYWSCLYVTYFAKTFLGEIPT